MRWPVLAAALLVPAIILGLAGRLGRWGCAVDGSGGHAAAAELLLILCPFVAMLLGAGSQRIGCTRFVLAVGLFVAFGFLALTVEYTC